MKHHAMKAKDKMTIFIMLALSLQWIVLKSLGIHPQAPFDALSPGIAIFGAAFMLSWGAELAQFEIPQSLAVAFLALIAVLPEYAVDMYFAWGAGKNPQYIHYATANMTGANRLLIGLGWATVVLAYYFKTKKGEVHVSPDNRIEIFTLVAATLYSFIIPFKGTLTWVDTLVFFILFGWYLFHIMNSDKGEPEVEGPIETIGHWERRPRIMATLFFFIISGYTIFIAAEPFAEGILSAGRHLGIEEFILVQWLAPIASESPEFIVAIIFALRAQASLSLNTLISSKVNQWTLLVSMLPLVYNLSLGTVTPMHLDARQAEEIFLTSAQSLFAIVIIANLRFSIIEALLLMVLFLTQMFFTTTEARTIYAFVYIALSVGWLFLVKGNLKGLYMIFKTSLRLPKNKT